MYTFANSKVKVKTYENTFLGTKYVLPALKSFWLSVSLFPFSFLDLHTLDVFSFSVTFILIINYSLSQYLKYLFATFAVQPCPRPYSTRLQPQSSPGADCDRATVMGRKALPGWRN